ncbi:hypothetical protein [Flexivirga alba]|uniref:Uncharacterized protein n=1 Tax=Flexivirga alba TaxID=702742 RepID=A0ABW2AF40_9MICO
MAQLYAEVHVPDGHGVEVQVRSGLQELGERAVFVLPPLVFVNEVLAGYRKHRGSDTSHRIRNGDNIRERVAAIGTISRHVAVARRPGTTRKALLYSFVYAARTSWGLARSGQWRVAATQAREGVRCLTQVPRALDHAEAAAARKPGDRPSYGPVRGGVDGF